MNPLLLLPFHRRFAIVILILKALEMMGLYMGDQGVGLFQSMSFHALLISHNHYRVTIGNHPAIVN